MGNAKPDRLVDVASHPFRLVDRQQRSQSDLGRQSMDRPVGEHEKRFKPLIELLEIKMQDLCSMQRLLNVR